MGGLDLDLLDTERLSWHRFFGPWIIGCLFETTLCVFTGLSIFPDDRFDIALFVLQISRFIFSIILTLTATFRIISQRTINGWTDMESQSLLANDERISYGAAPTDECETASDDWVIKEQQRKRLEEQGWLGYLKGFGVLLPCLWPSNSMKGHLCLAVLIFDIVADRVLRALAPRQPGVITDRLIGLYHGSAGFQVGIWVFLSWLRNPGGPLGAIKKEALMEVQNFSYEGVCFLAFKHIITGGSIMIDNQDLRNISMKSLRNALGVVPQDPSLFNRSILENVRYLRQDATDDEVFDACKAAAFHENNYPSSTAIIPRLENEACSS